MNDEQLFFDLFASEEPEPASQATESEPQQTAVEEPFWNAFDAEEGPDRDEVAECVGENNAIESDPAEDQPLIHDEAETAESFDVFFSCDEACDSAEEFPEEEIATAPADENELPESATTGELSLDEFFALPVIDGKNILQTQEMLFEPSEPVKCEVVAPSVPPIKKKIPAPVTATRKNEISPLLLRQAVLGFLAKQLPTAVGLRVPTRFRKFQVGMAACWFEQQNKTAKVVKVVAVDICDRREHCFPACSERASQLKELIALKAERAKMEEDIIVNEPDLKTGDDLFEEFQSYDFSRSANGEYHKLIRKIEKLHHAVYKGSRVESIRQARAADYLYIAVPAGELAAEEVAEGWGLLHIHPDRSVEVVKLAELQDCDEEGRRRLALNVAASSFKNVLFANGVQLDEELNVSFNPPPRRRRKQL